MRKTILKASAMLAMMIFFISASALDSESYIPYIVALISLCYLGVYAYANYED